MADETTQFILGDAAADALSRPPRRGWFGRWKNEPPPLTHCENCQAPLTGPFCAQCGQHAIDYRRSIMAVMIDAADSFFDWDTKFLRTLGVLLVRPGKLTNDFNAGRRMSYMHPLRLYLLGSIAFFLMARLIHLTPTKDPGFTPADRAELDAALGKLSAATSVLNPEQRAKVEAARARIPSPDAVLEPGQSAILGKVMSRVPHYAEKKKLTTKDLKKLDVLLDLMPMVQPLPPPLIAAPAPENAPATPSIVPKIPAPAATPDEDKSVLKFDNPDASKSPFGAWLETRVKSKIGDNGTNAQLFLDTLRGNIPTMMLFCIPLFAFVLKILYFFQRRYYIEHLVYALHIHTFAYIAAVIITLIGMGALRVLPSLQVLIVIALSLVATVQIFISIRRVYRQGWFFTTFKFFLGGVAYLVILVLAVGATAFVTLLLPN
ncbi:MAG TPA: DUF3667 domain-containing protein [Chthoniobacterales bacterium]|nr:DUF3667 domain-containing protein [Chthoniobacterales bacterium]